MNMLVADFIPRTCWSGNSAHKLIVDQSGKVSLLSDEDSRETVTAHASTVHTSTIHISTVGTTTEGP